MAPRHLRTLAAGVATAGLALAAAAGTALAVGHHTATPTPKAAGAALGSNWYAAAPYLMPLDNDPPDAGAVMDATGLKAFQLAFILAPNGGGCSPTWGGTSPVGTDTAVGGVISAIRAKGGDVSASVGGYGGTKLGQNCGTPEATAAAYQQVVDKYGLKALDFDLEEPEYENSAAIHNEIGAARILQQKNPGIYLSVTTAGTADGTGWFGKQMLNEAKAQSFTPDNFSIMPFDGGFQGAAAQTAALTHFNSLLQSTFGWDEATAYAHEGISQMNGRSDTGEFFTQADFQTVLDFATSHHMARFTNWSVNRDRQCSPPDNNGKTSGTCSSVPQRAYEFTTYSVKFAGATPPTTTPPTTPPPDHSCTAAAYRADTVYLGGDTASYGGHTWKAKWWTQGETPSTGGSGVWQDLGAC
ncbi:carbohydrate-binding protein [Streptomyces natalensis]|uniref:Chitinase n=1 Tax=Streptomyces natalensis ATCC 27448 TaxID=1240678 RepID=A0A0D7CJW8_9ACTN|nr:carbohydrate-binding protein [Streptomyces natalensis]KIZ16160.1 chitinase [Streptomyces natalensis ATCC 27448]